MDGTDRQGLEIRLLGPVSVALDGREISIGSPKQRVILAMLALSRRVSVDALAEELWRTTPPASVAATLQTLVSRLRRTLDAAGGGATIRSDAGGYTMDLEPEILDVHRFEEWAAAGRRALGTGAADDAGRRFRSALALWRGSALADMADRDFARTAVTRLDEARLSVVEDLAAAELAAGHPAAALEVLEPVVSEHPFRERPRGQQILALYRLGRQADALAAYTRLRHTLADELGLEPTPALQALERQILLQSPELDGFPIPSVGRSAGLGGMASAEPRLDSGTLAFLFTDIEASTARWEGDRAAMGADLERHDSVLREAFTAHDGQLFVHTGDGLGAVFPTVPAALSAAVAGQRALAAVDWKGSTPLGVRMAIHAGAAEVRAGTFLGPTLNRTARLLEHASGGQIVCSQAAADLARDGLPAGVSLVDLGERRLSGLSRPEQLWQVAHPDLSDVVVSLPNRLLAGHQIPATLTSFVGREAELAELSAQLTKTRLLTIIGLGGAGKTRLALELASRVEQHFADGACVMELVSVRDERLLASAVLAALAIDAGGLSGVPAAEERLCLALAERHLLLVLDNCEHLLEPVAALIDSILRRCPRVTILATSREVLSLAGETTWATPGLSLPPADPDSTELEGSDAVNLFIVRARAVQPGFGVTASNAWAVARICHRLDGIPLALELAAARVRVLGVAQLAERLDERFRLLTGGPRSVPTRHQTLRAAMDWSFDMLPEPERRLFRRISVFPQSFDLEAAGGVADGDDLIDVLDLLARLVDKSLVVPEGAADTARYSLLEIVREYARQKLVETGEGVVTKGLHRLHFAGRVRAWHGSGARFYTADWALQVALDRENFHTALANAVTDGDHESVTALLAGLWYPWFWVGSVPSVVEFIEAESLRHPDPSLHVEGLLGLGVALGYFLPSGIGGDAIDAIYKQALTVADTVGTPRDQGWVRYYLAYLAHRRGEAAAAHSWLDEALARFGTDCVVELASVHYQSGWIYLTEGDTATAHDHLQRGLSALEAGPGGDFMDVHLQATLALTEAARGNGDAALALARRAVEAARQLPFPGLLTMTLVRAAETAALAGSPGGPELAEALRLLRQQGRRQWVAATLTVAALTHEAGGRFDLAARLLGGVAAVAASLGEDPEPLPVVGVLVHSARRRLADALGPHLASEEAAGRRTPTSQLLDAALRGLDG